MRLGKVRFEQHLTNACESQAYASNHASRIVNLSVEH